MICLVFGGGYIFFLKKKGKRCYERDDDDDDNSGENAPSYIVISFVVDAMHPCSMTVVTISQSYRQHERERGRERVKVKSIFINLSFLPLSFR